MINLWYTCYTLVDITQTGITRSSDSVVRKERNQQRNYETLVQTIGLRCQPVSIITPELLLNQDMSLYSFGTDFGGRNSVWKMCFAIEHVDVFRQGDDPVGLLLEDVNQTPILTLLDETATLRTPIFSTRLDSKNTYFTADL
tara:strand:+ start:14429 stop:14854 length:426 start_codon:yes stop_codon:yes gene_type:complete